jgi:serine phosphatase RsbU (regulator of sigma subunit)
MKLSHRAFLVTAFLICGVSFVAQNRKIDSLFKVLSKRESRDTEYVKTVGRIARTFMNAGALDSAIRYGRMAYELADKISFYRIKGVNAGLIGQFHMYRGENDSAIHYFLVAQKSAHLAGDSLFFAGMYNNLANAYKAKGKIKEALDNYFLSLRLKERQKDSTGMANTATNIGNLYSLFEDTVNSLKYLNLGLTLRRAKGDSLEVGNSLTAIGLYYAKRNRLEAAKNYLRQALSLIDGSDAEGVAIANYNLGNVYFLAGDFRNAEPLYLKALDYAEANRDYQGMASCYETLGKMNCQLGKLDNGLVFLQKGLEAGKMAQIPELTANINVALSDAYELKKDYKNALKYYKDWVVVKDSLYSLENIRKLTSSELKYQHEKEMLLVEQEQKKKEELAKLENIKKNIVVASAMVIIILISVFAFMLSRRLRVNKMQKHLIEEQNHEIKDSINYAKTIQNAFLGDQVLINSSFKDNFICFLPKDIVSGDFYWAITMKPEEEEIKQKEYFFVAVCDCTGHGVPGAFMSLLIIGYLNEAIAQKRILEPEAVFNYVRGRLESNISSQQKDGMDGVLLRLDRSTGEIVYAAAHNAPVIVSGNGFQELPFDKMPVGRGERAESFKARTVFVKPGDMIYLYTDGFADQFGGPNGKKFKYRQLNETLVSISVKNCSEQSDLLRQKFDQWKGKLEQVDDVCVMGIRV